MQGNRILFLLDSIIYAPIAIIVAIVYILWNVYIIEKVRLFVKARSKALEKAKYDIFGNFAQLAENHKIEIIKYSLLFTINIIEGIAIVAFVCVIFGSYIMIYLTKSFRFPENFNESNCTRHFLHIKDLPSVTAITPLLNFIVAISQVGLLLTMTLCICLIKYLHNSYYNIGGNFKWNSRILLLASFISAVLLAFSVVPQLLIIQRIIEPLIQTVCFSFLVKHLRIFHRTLKRRTIDLRIICKPSVMIRSSIRLVRQFTIISTLNCFGIACIIITEFLTQYTFVITTTLYFSPCFSEYAYGTVFYEPPLLHRISLGQLKIVVVMINWITNFIICLGSVCILSHYLSISFFVLAPQLCNNIKTKLGISLRYSPIITQPLLI